MPAANQASERDVNQGSPPKPAQELLITCGALLQSGEVPSLLVGQVMNCAELGLWTKEAVETQTGAYLHRFQGIPDEKIGEIPKTWNTLDWMDEHTKLIHYTSGGPWFEQCKDHPYGAAWLKGRDEYRASLTPAGASR